MPRGIVVFFAAAGAFAVVHPAVAAFSVSECAARLSSTDILPKYRLTHQAAVARCTAAAVRVARISKMVVGTWTRTDERGRHLRMQFLPDGTLRVHSFDYGMKTMQDRVTTWSVDENNFMLDNIATEAKFTGRLMILTSQPASATIVERWTREN